MRDVIKMRPHHLLCTQSYEGKGYDDSFVRNMDEIVGRLQMNPEAEVEIVFSTDDLCRSCPNKRAVDLCVTNEKVKHYDDGVIRYFGIEEKRYLYWDVISEIKEKMNEEILNDICGGCGWLTKSRCRELLLKNDNP